MIILQHTYNFQLESFSVLIVFILMLTGFYLWRTHRLKKAKIKLEKIIEIRTAELRNKEQEITDSIRYALRIQLSIIPTAERFQNLLPKSFVFYKPKDIVSGDFYWIDKVNDEVLFSAVDCTGHGVPGAMMSVIGLKSLNQATQDKQLSKPADILRHLDIEVNDTLRQSYDKNSVKDGMDLALCSINFKTNVLQYAGVFNSLWLVRKNIANTYQKSNNKIVFYGDDLLEIKADKLYIGNNTDGIADTFTNHEINLQTNDCIYIFTDGFADQFGGEKGKKFKYNALKNLLISLVYLEPDEQKQKLEQAFEAWKGGLEQVDDVLLIGIKI